MDYPTDFKHLKASFPEQDTFSAADYPALSKEEWLRLFFDVLVSHDIRVIVLYGTALGAHRDKQLIPWDHDADLGIYLNDLTKLKGAVSELNEKGFRLCRPGRFQVVFGLPNMPFLIDIWPIKKMRNPLFRAVGYKWLCDHVYFKQNFFDKLSPIKLVDRDFFCPTPIESYLAALYGPEWRTPVEEHIAGPRGKVSQLINSLFVDFPVPAQFSGEDDLGVFKPWASRVLKFVAPNAKITQKFKHPLE